MHSSTPSAIRPSDTVPAHTDFAEVQDATTVREPTHEEAEAGAVRTPKSHDRAEILARLDVIGLARQWGVRLTGKVNDGWHECHAFDRPDDVPSAGVNAVSGVYHDFGSGGNLGFFDLAVALGVYPTWREAQADLAARAGLGAPAGGPKRTPTIGKPVAGKVAPGAAGGKPPREYATFDEAVRAGARLVARQEGPVKATVVHAYDAGDLAYRVARYELVKGGKSPRPVMRTPQGTWVLKAPDVRPLYRRDEILRSTGPIVVVEGEKCADIATSLGLEATTTPHGAQSARKADLSPLAGRDVVILPDHDENGEKYAETIKSLAMELSPPARVKIVRLPGLAGKGDDIEQFVALHPEPRNLARIGEEILALAEAAPAEIQTFRAVVADEDEDDGRFQPRETPDDPHRLGRIFVSGHRIGDEDGIVTHNGDIYRYQDHHFQDYRDAEPDMVGCIRDEFERVNRREVEAFLEKAAEAGVEVDPSHHPPIRHVKRTLVAESLMAVRSETCLSSRLSAPCWIGDDADGLPRPADVIVVRNGLLDVASRRLYPHTPRYFNLSAPLPFDHDPSAPPPGRWLRLLDELWADDPQTKRELRKWIGYALTPATDQHRILLMVGPPRSGKGTIQRLLQGLLGPGNATFTSLATLASPFGLQPLLGKSLAMVPDAKFCGRGAEMAAAVERLVSISGEDAQSVNRKYKDELVVRLPLKFFIFANEPPNLRDQSGALAYRISPLEMTKTFLGREDRNLDAKLAAERSGILNWALDGIDMLREDGGFLVPESCRRLHQAIVETTSPTKAFIADCVTLVPDDTRSASSHPRTEEVYRAYQAWCRDNGNKPASSSVFGRNLRAAEPQIDDYRPTVNGARDRRLKGVELNETGRRLANRFGTAPASGSDGGDF